MPAACHGGGMEVVWAALRAPVAAVYSATEPSADAAAKQVPAALNFVADNERVPAGKTAVRW